MIIGVSLGWRGISAADFAALDNGLGRTFANGNQGHSDGNVLGQVSCKLWIWVDVDKLVPMLEYLVTRRWSQTSSDQRARSTLPLATIDNSG